MPELIPPSLTFTFYGLIAWGLSALFVAFRYLAGGSIKASLWMRAGVLVWLGVPAVLAVRGVFADFDAVPPHLMKVVVPMALVVVAFSFSRWGKWAAERLPLTLLVGVQVFRLPLEIVLYYLGKHGAISQEMTLAGYNFDIATGAFALVVWLLLHKQSASAAVVWAFNIVGTLLLATVVTIAVLGFPAPFGWFQPPNTVVAYYPWAWLPTFLVQLALVSHLLVYRKLLLPAPPARQNV
jgi:hypothetical protein